MGYFPLMSVCLVSREHDEEGEAASRHSTVGVVHEGPNRGRGVCCMWGGMRPFTGTHGTPLTLATAPFWRAGSWNPGFDSTCRSHQYRSPSLVDTPSHGQEADVLRKAGGSNMVIRRENSPASTAKLKPAHAIHNQENSDRY